MSTMRKILATGVGAALMTEDGIREYLARQTQKGKDEIVKVVLGELKKFLEHLDLQSELRKALSGMTIEVEAKVRLTPSARKKTPFQK